MGTSADYLGSPKWGAAKRQATASAGASGRSPEALHRVLSSFVGQMRSAAQGGNQSQSGSGGGGNQGGGASGGGGRRGGSKSRPSGIRGVAGGVGGFLSDVAQHGLKQALEDLGLGDLAGKSPEDITLALADALGGPASTIDQVDLRNALSDLMDDMMGDAATFEALETAFATAAARAEQLVKELFGNYIYHRFCSTMYKGLSERHGIEVAKGYLTEIKEYIHSRLALEGGSRKITAIDWRGTAGARVVDTILNETFAVFGG